MQSRGRAWSSRYIWYKRPVNSFLDLCMQISICMKLQSCHNLDFAFHLLYSELERLYKIYIIYMCMHSWLLFASPFKLKFNFSDDLIKFCDSYMHSCMEMYTRLSACSHVFVQLPQLEATLL